MLIIDTMLKSIFYLLVNKFIMYKIIEKIQNMIISIIYKKVDNKPINYSLIPYINFFIKLLDYFLVYILPIINIDFYKLINFYNKNKVLQFINSNLFFYKLYISNLLSILININLKDNFIYSICNFLFLRIVIYEIIYKKINNNHDKLMPITTFIHLYELKNLILKYYKSIYLNNNILSLLLSLILFFCLVEKIIFDIKYLYLKVKF